MPGRRVLRTPVATPLSTRSIIPSEKSSVWMPSSRRSWRALSTVFGIDPMPAWMQAPSSIRSATWAAMRRSHSSGSEGSISTSGRSTSHQPATWDRWMALRPIVRGMRGFASTKKGTRPMNGAT